MRVLCLVFLVSATFAATCTYSTYPGCVTVGGTNSTQTARTQQLCGAGYYWNSQACMPCKQVPNGYYTCSSYLGTGTLTCYSSYTNINGACVQIPTGCTAYSLNSNNDAYVCTACDSVHTLISGVCLQNLNCATYDGDAVCTGCVSGYFLNWDVQFEPVANVVISNFWYNYPNNVQTFCDACGKTLTNCLTCSSAYTCTTCAQGYYWQQSTSSVALSSQNSQLSGKCATCISGCMTCTSSTQCTACYTNYYGTKDSTGTYFVSCTQCPNGCTTCSSSSVCTACATSYYMNASNLCTALPNYCTAVNSNYVCTACQAQYTLNSSNQCVACSNGCQSCTWSTSASQVTCSTCYDLYYGVLQTSGIYTCNSCNQNNGVMRCQGQLENQSYTSPVPTQCQNGYYLYTFAASGTASASTVCISVAQSLQCVTITATSSTSYSCATCTTMTSLYNTGTSNQCLSCSATNTSSLPAGCSTCTGSPSSNISCTACFNGYYYTAASGTTSATCTACGTNCATCTSAGCSVCSAGFFVSSGACVSCGVTNCNTCSAANTCSTCINTYFLATNTTGSTTTVSCNLCPSECATCTSPGNLCATCRSGYVLQNGGCVTLANANCADAESYSTLAAQQTPETTSGCAICYYGFYNFNYRCLQTVEPYAGFAYVAKTSSIGTTPSTSKYVALLQAAVIVLLMGY